MPDNVPAAQEHLDPERQGHTDVRVFVITHCRDMDLLYGSTLVFGSLRKGFPTATITVFDNGSLPEARLEIRKLAESVGANFPYFDEPAPHHDLIAGLAASTPGPAVFVDPDVVFWEQVEHWEFPGNLAAGRLIPEFDDPYSGCLTAPRLHTSLLWIPDTQVLLAAVGRVQSLYFDFDALTPYTFRDRAHPNLWRRFDTGASMYAAFKDDVYVFGERELEAYDHLFCGSHLPLVAPHLPREVAQLWGSAHEAARSGELSRLKGMYRQQQAFFESLGVG